MDKGADDSHSPSPDVPIPLVRASYLLHLQHVHQLLHSVAVPRIWVIPGVAGLVIPGNRWYFCLVCTPAHCTRDEVHMHDDGRFYALFVRYVPCSWNCALDGV